jgi:hypothetical protein
MTELELNRARRDRRLYALEGIGTVRLQGMLAHSASRLSGVTRRPSTA